MTLGELCAFTWRGADGLFDNVIDPDAEEDMVGVSRKLLETLTDDLAKMGLGEEVAPNQKIIYP